MRRSSWDETWLRIAQCISYRSRCTNRRVGAVIVSKTNRCVAVGYNGQPRGLSFLPLHNDCSDFCERSGGDRGQSYENCVAIHAEANALLFADRSTYEGGTIYVTNPPCWECAKMIANSGLDRCVAMLSKSDSHYDNEKSRNFLEKCGVKTMFIYVSEE